MQGAVWLLFYAAQSCLRHVFARSIEQADGMLREKGPEQADQSFPGGSVQDAVFWQTGAALNMTQVLFCGRVQLSGGSHF